MHEKKKKKHRHRCAARPTPHPQSNTARGHQLSLSVHAIFLRFFNGLEGGRAWARGKRRGRAITIESYHVVQGMCGARPARRHQNQAGVLDACPLALAGSRLWNGDRLAERESFLHSCCRTAPVWGVISFFFPFFLFYLLSQLSAVVHLAQRDHNVPLSRVQKGNDGGLCYRASYRPASTARAASAL